MEKYWLLNHIDLNRDVLGYINQYLQIKVIKPLTMEDFQKMANLQLNVDGVIYDIRMYDSYKKLSRTVVQVENYMIQWIMFFYDDQDDQHYNYHSVYVNFKSSNINPK